MEDEALTVLSPVDIWLQQPLQVQAESHFCAGWHRGIVTSLGLQIQVQRVHDLSELTASPQNLEAEGNWGRLGYKQQRHLLLTQTRLSLSAGFP